MLGKYTPNVEQFLKEKQPGHRWKEDVIFSARRRVEYHLNMVGAEIMNRAFRADFLKAKNKAVVLPSCMRYYPKPQCKARSNGVSCECAECTPQCRVNQLVKMGRKFGFSVHLVPHESSVLSGDDGKEALRRRRRHPRHRLCLQPDLGRLEGQSLRNSAPVRAAGPLRLPEALARAGHRDRHQHGPPDGNLIYKNDQTDGNSTAIGVKTMKVLAIMGSPKGKGNDFNDYVRFVVQQRIGTECKEWLPADYEFYKGKAYYYDASISPAIKMAAGFMMRFVFYIMRDLGPGTVQWPPREEKV